MNGPVGKLARCAIYTRKSTEHNLDLAFNSLDAQREACEAYIKSQAHEVLLPRPLRPPQGGVWLCEWAFNIQAPSHAFGRKAGPFRWRVPLDKNEYGAGAPGRVRAFRCECAVRPCPQGKPGLRTGNAARLGDAGMCHV
jgi:hypothetical protein